ncbi:MAG TPA: ABC transporter ATP-binding protein [candidate division Zixibacteria bacterium]|nr:ABC transporter ATP-binding protein [candidate division Zixibacteria bacterium]
MSDGPTSQLKKMSELAPYLRQAFELVWKAARRWTVAWAVLLVVQGMLPVGLVYLTRALVDNIAGIIGTGLTLAELRPTVMLVAAMALLLLLTESLHGIARWVRTSQAELVKDYINTLIHHKASTLDLSFYESSDWYDRMHRAKYDALSRPITLLENMGGLLQNGLTLAAMAIVLTTFASWIPLLLLVSTGPALAVVLKYARRQHEWQIRNTQAERRTRYYDWILTVREAAAELRLFELSAYFLDAFQSLRRRLRIEKLQIMRNQAFAEWWAAGLGVLAMGGAMGWMVWRAVQGQVSIGDLAMFYQAFQQGQRMMRTLLENVGQIYQNSLFLENLFGFLGTKPELYVSAHPAPIPDIMRDGIQFEDITFRYPASEIPVMEHFSLDVPANKMVAIVGTNGAGKSTLIKLLCRFYDPEKGQVKIDGIDIREHDIDALRHMITVLFQEPVHYHESAGDNIRMGDLANNPSAEEVHTAARNAGADGPVSRLPEGYETMLGKWFGGADLSTGEWQRVALARAFLRKAPIIVLDEPTSAMDVWAEVDWMARFRTLTEGRTTLVITHRFTTAMQADIIHIMDGGRLIESGTHEELIAQDGRYAQSWRAQQRTGR